MNNWNAVDLHMHTAIGFTKDKKKDQVNFKYLYFVNSIIKFKIKLCAVTNHNIIAFENYILMHYLAKKLGSNILLGVELDTLTEKDKSLHVVSIFEKNFSCNFELSRHINNATNQKLKNQSIIYTPKDIVELLKKYDALMIPHGDKPRGIFEDASEDNINEALKKVKEGFIRIFDSPSNWKLEQIKNFLSEIGEENLDRFGGVLFSDIRDWNKYDEKFRNFHMNAEPTFKGLLHSITNPTKRFKKFESINENHNYIYKMVISNDSTQNKIKPTTLYFSNDYNCVIGKSGSGKSLLLHLIKKKLLKSYDPGKNYTFADNTIVEIYNEQNQLLNYDMINVDVGASLYDKIISANTSNDNNDIYSVIELINNKFIKQEKFKKFKEEYATKIKQYYNLISTRKKYKQKIGENLINFSGKVSKKNALLDIKIFNVNIDIEQKISYTSEYLQDFKNYTNILISLKNKLADCLETEKNIVIKLIDQIDIQMKLIQLKMTLRDHSQRLKNKKISKIKEVIETINGIKSTKAKDKTKIINELPENISSIVNLVMRNYINNLQINKFNFSINNDDINDEKIVNSKHNILVKEHIEIDFKNIILKENKIFNTYGKKSILPDCIYDITKPEEAIKIIDLYIKNDVINDSKNFFNNDFDISVQILFDGQDVKKLNPGTIAKTYISIYFEEEIKNGENQVILFDQIENDVDKSFISETLKELIEDTKGFVQVIIVTHDPIVAVNADPTNYIESIKEDNNFNYRHFKPESQLNDELTTIAKNVDGSKIVIKNRYEIYGGDNI